jgi:uncharacterized protein YlxP (DUF503 family)
MLIGLLTLHLFIPGCTSLKEKRSRIKPVLARLHREFNVSTAEIELLDKWREAVLVCAMVSNDHGYTQKALQTVMDFFTSHWPDLEILDYHIELI